MARFNQTEVALFFDRYLFGGLVILSRFFKTRNSLPGCDPSRVRQIVISKYVGMGSILLTHKLLAFLKKTHPDAKIIFLTFDKNEQLFEYLRQVVDEVIFIPTRGIGRICGSLMRVTKVLRDRKIDLFFDLEFFSRFSALLCFWTRPKVAVGYESLLLMSRTSLYGYPAKYIVSQHMEENFANQARALGYAISKESNGPELSLKQELMTKKEKELRAQGLPPQNYIVLNPNASDALGGYRKWPPDEWVELIRCISKNISCGVVLTGLSADRSYAGEIASKAGNNPRVYNLAGQCDFHGFLALLKLSRLVITIDSGTAHFAVSLRCPTVVLFGPETPLRYGYDRPYVRNIYKNLYCSPCYNVYHGKKVICRNDNQCMKQIRSEEVWKAAEELL